jgi:hypothetical protein
MYDEARITVEVISAVACFILLKFMIKPYGLTGEGRYLGLPLGFSFLGLSYALSALTFSISTSFDTELHWLQLLIRTFAFVFLAVTYYFSNKPAKKSRQLWNITFSLLTVGLFILLLIVIINPQSTIQAYYESQLYIRIFNVVCLAYVAIQTLRSHVKQLDPTTIWIPQGFILLGVSQYSLLFYYTDNSHMAFAASLVLRLMALTIFLFVACRSFYSPRKRIDR